MRFRSLFKRKLNRFLVAGLALAGVIFGVIVASAADPGVTSRIDYAMTLNGTDSYLRSSSQVVPNNSDFTVEAYFKVTASTNGGVIWATGSDGASGANQLAFGVYSSSVTDGAKLFLIDGSPSTTSEITGIGLIPVDDWVHSAFTYSLSTDTYQLFVNGYLAQTGTLQTSSIDPGLVVGRAAPAATPPLWGGASFFKGQIDEIKVFNSVRTQAQIVADHSTYLPANTAGLRAQYDFNEGAFGNGFIFDRTSNDFNLEIVGNPSFSDIAQYTIATGLRTNSNIVRFNRSYLTAVGGWTSPGGVGTITGNAYGGGGGGGGGGSTDSGQGGGGGGGGGAGNRLSISQSVANAGSVVEVRVGLGGIGAGTQQAGTPGTAGQPGYSTKFASGSASAGGLGGAGGGYAYGQGSTLYPGLGGKGGDGGAATGATANINDGIGGGGASASASNSRSGGAGRAETLISGSPVFMSGGTGGTGAASTRAFAALPTSGTGSGGGGGAGTSSSLGGFRGASGSAGAIVLSYTVLSTAQDADYLYTFNGTSQYAESNVNVNAFDLTGDFTLAAWVNPSNTCPSGYCVIAGRENNYSIASAAGTYRWRITTSSGGSVWYNTGVPVTVGQWQHVALVRSGASALFYLNGQLVSSLGNGGQDSSGVTVSLTNTSAVGAGWFAIATRGPDHEDMFAGGIDEVRIWSVARTAAELGDPNTGEFNRPLSTAELASANLVAYWDMNDTLTRSYFANRKTGAMPNTDLQVFGAPTSVSNNSATILSNAYLTLKSANAQAAYSSDSEAFELTGNSFTISAWWQISSCSSPNYLVSKANSYTIATDSACRINFQLDPGNEGDGQSWQWMNSGYVMPLNTWQYVSLVKVGTTASVYVNGALVSTISNGDSVPGFDSAANVTAVVPANLGNRDTFFGLGSLGTGATRTGMTTQNIDDVRLWSTSRASSQALDMNGFVARNSQGLKALFNFDTMLNVNTVVPNRAVGAASSTYLTMTASNFANIATTSNPPANQPSRWELLIKRSVIVSSTQTGSILNGTSTIEYWLAGGGGGGGAGGNSGYSGGGGGAGGLAEGIIVAPPYGIPSGTVTTWKVGPGGRYAVNDGDSVNQTAGQGSPSSITTTGASIVALGGGAGGSGTANPTSAVPGSAGGSGGGSGQTGGAGGLGSQGFAGGSGSSLAAGGGGGARSAGADAVAGAGGAGGAGYLLPSRFPTWVQGGGTGFGSGSASNTNAAFGSTAAGVDAEPQSASGGGGSGFATPGTGVVRGGLGGSGFILLHFVQTQPYLDSAPSSLQSGAMVESPFVASIRAADGSILTSNNSETITLEAVSGCTVSSGGSSTAVTAGQVTFDKVVISATAAGSCNLRLVTGTATTTFNFSVPVRTSPSSISVTSAATTAGCSFVSGSFTCPNATVANLSATDLNAQLDSQNSVTLATATSGSITIGSGLSIGGSVGSLKLMGGNGVTLNSGIALTGSGKGLTIQTYTGSSSISQAAGAAGNPLVFSTNGGQILLNPGVQGTSTSRTLYLNNYTSWLTNGGAFVVGGGSSPNTSPVIASSTATGSTDTDGIRIKSGATISTGAGSVQLRGQYSGQYNAPTLSGAGVYLESSSSITTTTGSIQISGTGSNISGANGNRYAVSIESATIYSVSGAINISGDSTADSNGTYGIYTAGIALSGAFVTSNSGNVNMVSRSAQSSRYAGYNLISPVSTVGSVSGNVTLDNPILSASWSQLYQYLKLTGAGTHTLVSGTPRFNSSDFTAEGTGDFVLTSSLGTGSYGTAALNLSSSFNLGTGYRNISVVDAGTNPSFGIVLNTTLTASETVSLRAKEVSGTGAVVAPGLAIRATHNSTAASYSSLSGASDVDTLAIVRGISPTNSTYIGISDADGWTPGTVAGVAGVYGVPSSLSLTTAPSASVTRNQVLPIQPAVSVVDSYGIPIGAGNTLGDDYAVTPGIAYGGAGTLSPLTPVQTVDGVAAFTGLKINEANTFYRISFTVAPALPASSTTSTGNINVAASGSPTQIVLNQSTVSGTSGTNINSVGATYLDAYGNAVTSLNGQTSARPSITLTSAPTGGSLSTGSFSSPNTGGNTSATINLVGPTGTYVLTVRGTATGTTNSTATLTVNLTGWSVDYGGTSLGYSTSTYPATFSGNGTGAVTYSSSTTSICTVNSATGALTTVNVGTCTVTASQATDGTNPAGSGTVTLTIVKGTQGAITVSSSPSSLIYGSSVTLSASGGNGTGSFSYTKVSGNCTLSGATLSAGSANAGETCVVTATRAGGTLWNAGTSSNFTLTVSGAAQATVTVPTGQTVGYASTVDLTQSPYVPSGGSGSGAWQFSTSSPNCSINGNLLTTSNAVGGTCVVQVVKAGNGNYADSTPVNMTLTTVKGNQTVGFVTVASSVRVGESTTVSATSSSGLVVTYSIASGSNAFCTITGNTVTFTAAGTCTVNANQAGDANYNAASTQTLTYTVSKGLQSITFSPIANDVVRTTTLTASATASSGLAVTYSTGPNTTNSSCSVASSGAISLNAIGVCEVVASQTGNANYEAAADAVVTFSIAQGTQSALSITSSSTVAYGNTITLTASGGNGSSSYSWSATGDCTVAGNILTVGDAGSNCVVSVDRAGDANWFAATTATQTVTITKANQATLTVVASNSVVFGNTILLNTSGGSGLGAVTYSTTGTCTESGGLLTLGDAGSNCSVTATKAGSLNYNSATSVAFSIAVTRAQQAAVSITSGNSVAYGSTLQLSAAGGSGSGSISYSTTGTCSVSGSILTPGSAGSSCTVTATRAQSTNYLSESSAAMTITVTKANQSITFTSNPTAPKALGSYTVAATADSGLSVSFTIAPSSSSVCSISGSVVSFATSGSCVILADQAGDSNFEPATQQSQTVIVGLAAQSITFTNPGTKQYGDAAFAPSASSSSGLALVFTVGLATTNSACSIDGQGRISIDDVGTCQILADQSGSNVYDAAAQVSATFTIGKGNQATLTITSASTVVYGNTISLTTSGGSGTGAVTYTTSGTCTVSGSTLTLGNAGSSCTVTATKATDARYLAASSSAQTVSITKANQVVTITSSPGSATALGTYSLTATSTSGEAVTFTIDSNSANVCSLSGSTVTYLTSGVCTIYADQAGNTNFNAATQTAQIVSVGKAAQTITLTNPGQKRVGDASFNAGATTSSNLQIAYSLGSSTTNSACTVSSSGQVTVLAVGDCEIVADQAGDSTYNSATTARAIFAIAQGNQATLSITSVSSVVFGNTISLATSGGSGSGGVTYSTTGTCSVSGSTLTVGDAGSACTVTATKAADSNYQSASSAAQTVTTTKASQTISLSAAAGSAAALGSNVLTVSASSGLQVALTVDASTASNCSLTGTTVNFLRSGSCLINADQSGNTNFDPASQVQQSFTIAKAAQTVSITNPGTVRFGDAAFSIAATASSGLAITYSTGTNTTNSACSVASNGTVTINDVGDCEVTANQSGNAVYDAATATSLTFQVVKGYQSALSITSANGVTYGGTISLTTSGGSGTGSVTYSTTGTCSVSGSTLTVGDAGSACTVTATKAADSQYMAASSSVQTVTINKAGQSALTISSAGSVVFGNTISLTTSGGSGTGAVTYSTTGTCSVSGSTLTVGDAGSACTVTATKAADTNYVAESSSAQTVTITKANQQPLVITSSSSGVYGDTIVPTTSGGSGNGAVTFTVAGLGCTLSQGQVALVGAGRGCDLTAYKAASTNYNAVTSSVQSITVNKANQTITVTTTASNPKALGYYNPTATSDSGLNVTFSVDASSNSVCQVRLVSVEFLTSGTCLVNFDQAGDPNYNAAPQVQQSITVAKTAQNITFPQIGTKRYQDAAFQAQAYSNSGLPISYSVGNLTTNNSCSVTSGGLISILDTGFCEIYANQAGDSVYSAAAQVSQNFPIDLASQSPVTLTNASTVTYGNTLTLTTTGGSGTGAVSYAVAAGTCTISGAVLSVGNAGSLCTVYAVKARDSQFADETSQILTVTVTRANQASFSISSASSVVFGNAISLTTSGGSGTGAVTYATTGTCSETNGILTVGDAGSACTVTATKAQSTNFNAATSATQTITVTKANQTVTFTTTPVLPTANGSYTVVASADSGLSVSTTVDSGSASVCSITGSTVNFLTSGSCVLNANQAGNTNFNAASQVQQTITVAKAAQSISLTNPGSKQFGASAFSVTGAASSGLTPTYSLGSQTTNSACSVASNGTVTINAVGTCEVLADQAGDATYSAAPQASVTFAIAKANQAALSISSASSVAFGNTISLTTTGGSGSGAVTYATTGTCSVSGSTLTVGDAGSACTVTATKAADANYLAESSTAQTITITRANQATLTVAMSSTQAYGTTQLLNFAGGSGPGAVTYSATGTCSISGSSLTIGAVGTNCSITASKAQSQNYSAATSVAFSITATKVQQSISFTTSTSTATALGTYSVAATATSGLVVTIGVASASSSVCSISGSTVTFLTGGTCVLEANQAGDANFDPAAQALQTLNVSTAAQTISFTRPADLANGSNAVQLAASASSALPVSYSLGGGTTNGACTVTSSGSVTPVAVGTCEIVVSQLGNATYSAATAVARSFEITRASQSALSIASASSVAYGSTINLSTSGGSGTGSVTYSTTGTCSVSGSTLTVGDAGSACTVTATKAQDANYFATISPAQTVTITRANQATLSIASLSSMTYGQSLALVSTGGSGSGAETWSVDSSTNVNSAGCQINNSNATLGVQNAGSCDIIVRKAASTNFNQATSAAFTVTATKAAQNINFTSTVPANPVPGGSYNLVASANSGLAVTFTLDAGSSAFCSLAGSTITFNAAGNCVVNATQSGDNRYLAAATASQTIAIGSLNQTITFANLINRTYGDPSFTLGATVPSTSTVTYALGGGTTNSACSVSSVGLVNVLNIGRCEIVASAQGDNRYAAASSVTRAFDIVADRAGAPFITSVSAGNASVTVAFTAPGYTGGAAISGYDINAYRNGILVATSSNCASNATTCTISGLTNGYTYTIKMAAINAAGSGAESAASGNVTPYTRPEAVGALTAVASNNAIALSWQQPTSMGGGTFVSYQIFVRNHGGSYPQTPTATVNSSTTTSHTLNNLTNGQAYDIKVVTITTASSTQLTSNTAEVQQTPMTVPDAPQQLTIIETQVDGVVDVSWAAPNSNGGSPITSYTVDLGQGHSCTVSGNATTCTITNLTSAATYNVSAYATNAAGNSLNAGTVITLRAGSAVTSSGPTQFTAAFGLTVERVTAFASIDTTDRKQVSTAGGSRIVIAGFNLDKVTRVTVDGRPVVIINKTSSAMLLQLPGSENPGWADLWFYAPNASLRYVDGIYYSTATIHPAKRPLTRVIYGFVTVQKKIIPWQKALIKSAVVKAGPAKSVTCTGIRANAALTCAIVKQMNPKLAVKIVPTKPKSGSLAATVIKVTFNY